MVSAKGAVWLVDSWFGWYKAANPSGTVHCWPGLQPRCGLLLTRVTGYAAASESTPLDDGCPAQPVFASTPHASTAGMFCVPYASQHSVMCFRYCSADVVIWPEVACRCADKIFMCETAVILCCLHGVSRTVWSHRRLLDVFVRRVALLLKWV